MTDRTLVRVATAVGVGGTGCGLVAVTLHIAAGSSQELLDGWTPHALLAVLPLSVGLVVLARHRPRHAVTWILGFVTCVAGVQALADGVATLALARALGVPEAARDAAWADVPAGVAAVAWVPRWAWLLVVCPLATSLLLRFPDGRLPSPRWRVIESAAVVGTVVLALAFAIGTWPGHMEATEPLAGWGGELRGSVAPRLLVGLPVVVAAGVGSVASMVVRHRAAGADVRRQLRWVAPPVAALGVTVVAQLLPVDGVGPVVRAATFLLVPLLVAAVVVAIVAPRRWDVDVLVVRTVAYGVLAALVGATYLVVATVAARLVGGAAQEAAAVVATGAVAVLFQPLRLRLERGVRRLVLGDRATPYEVLAEYARGIEAGSDEDLLLRATRLLCDGTGAAAATVWIHLDDLERPAATWPPTAAPVGAAEADVSEVVSRDGVRLGAVTVRKPSGEPAEQGDRLLTRDIAGSLSVVLRNAYLTQALRDRVEELAASRGRLVRAGDDVRRTIEQAIEGGVIPHLETLRAALDDRVREARELDLPKAATLLEQIVIDVDRAQVTIREVAAGVHPPLLAADGLVAALRAQAERVGLVVTVDGSVGAVPDEVALACYFACSEAIQNTAKYAAATNLALRVEEVGGELRFTVRDDGVGFDRATAAVGTGLANMADRLDAIGGRLRVTSRPGEGTTVTGVVPLAAATS